MTDDELRAAGWVNLASPLHAMDAAALVSAGWVRQSRRAHTLHGTPRVGQVFWVDFPHDAYVPEFVGEHPGVIIRAANNMSDPVVLVPLTHRLPGANPHAHKLSVNPDRRDPRDAFAICNHLYTIALGRLRRFEQKGFQRDVALSHGDLMSVFGKIQQALARVFTGPPPVLPPPASPRPIGPNTLSLRPKS